MSLGSELRRLRQHAGLTQERLAERAGVSVATIGALEEGVRRRSHPYTMVALADALGLSKDERARLLEAASLSSAQGRQPTPPGAGDSRWRPPQSARTAAVEAAIRTAQVRLPMPPTALIGRESELEAGATALDPLRSAGRLLTLTGPGGVGKTRLALAIGAALADAYADGVVFVDLASLRDDRLVPATIARALELFACIAARAGLATTAARWFGIAEKTRGVMGRGFALATFRSAYDEGVEAARAALGPAAFEAAWSHGRTLTLDEALRQAMTKPTAGSSA